MDKIRLDDYNEIPDVLKNSPQLIRIEKGNKWLNIDTSTVSSNENTNSLNLMVSREIAISYLSASMNLGGKAILNADTKVIKVPYKTVDTPTGTKEVIDADNRAGFIVGDIKTLQNTTKYSFTAYNSDSSSYTPEVVLLKTKSALDTGSPIVLVSKAVIELNDDDEAVTTVHG